MADLTHLFTVGQKVVWVADGKKLNGTVKETYTDHIIVDVPDVCDHCWFSEDINLDYLYPDYNFM